MRLIHPSQPRLGGQQLHIIPSHLNPYHPPDIRREGCPLLIEPVRLINLRRLMELSHHIALHLAEPRHPMGHYRRTELHPTGVLQGY